MWTTILVDRFAGICKNYGPYATREEALKTVGQIIRWNEEMVKEPVAVKWDSDENTCSFGGNTPIKIYVRELEPCEL